MRRGGSQLNSKYVKFGIRDLAESLYNAGIAVWTRTQPEVTVHSRWKIGDLSQEDSLARGLPKVEFGK